MRPSVLFPLFADIASLRGVGPRLAPLYLRLCGTYVADILWHLPVGMIDRSYQPQLKYADRDRIVTLQIKIAKHVPPARRSLPYRIIGEDDTAQIYINYFNVKGDYLAKLYPTDQPIVISGLLERYQGGWSITHPDYVVPLNRRDDIPKFEPVYALTEGISGKMLRKLVQLALQRAPELPEWHDTALLKREQWPDWKSAINTVQQPASVEQIDPKHPARRRLAYDEFLADQLALAVIRRHHRTLSGRTIAGTHVLQNKLEQSLPFTLTTAQKQAIAEIAENMAAPKRMLRLLQGDVGSGKTIVALFAMLQAVESGLQVALMVPTEILARQHYTKLNTFLEPLGIKIGLLLGKGRNRERQLLLAQLADGLLPIVVGTHALFQDGIKFKDLGLAVIDEQHRFGVQQRLQLSEKGRGVDILVMTATPIPRTLTLTAYGDLDISVLDSKPAGRQPIDTRLIDLARLDEVVAGIRRQLSQGAQIYWVCPLVEESENSDLAAATERAEFLQQQLGTNQVGLLHGRMNSEAKEQTMATFASGKLQILVATTVIEVGVDVPNASVMIIEHAERFGLAQLHQLRGRVGRGSAKSTCLLLYRAPLGETAKARLTMMRDTADGFRIAEEDLRLRGPGELLGLRQSGLPEFRLADLTQHRDLLAIAHDDAKLILHQDPQLETPRGQALRTLLYLFAKDAAVKLFQSG